MTDEFQVVFPGNFRSTVERWLESRDLYLAGPIPGLEDDLPTFFIGIPEVETAQEPVTKKDPPEDPCPRWPRVEGCACRHCTGYCLCRPKTKDLL